MMNEERSQNRIPELNANLPDEEQARILRDALDWLERLARDAGQGIELSDDEAKRLRSYSRERGPDVRRLAVEFLIHFYNGPVGWEDFETWCLDPDADIRSMAMDAVDWQSRPLGELCLSDKPRCVDTIARSVALYGEGDFELRQLAWENDEWLDIIWEHIGTLIDTAKPELFARLTSRFLVEVLKTHEWGPENPHISPWIESDRTQRKMAILGAALSLWPVEGNLRQTVEALTNDPDPVIAHIAKVALREDTGRMELTMDHYELVRNRLAMEDGVFE